MFASWHFLAAQTGPCWKSGQTSPLPIETRFASLIGVVYHADMRTTFSPDPDVAPKLEMLARSRNKSMSRVLNEVLREALSGIGQKNTEPRFVVEPFPLGLNPGVDRLRLNQLVDDFEDEQVLERMKRERGHS